jgi:hypothetical protein
MQIGGALGVAVLGTALTIRYQDILRPLLAHQAVPAAIERVILGSVGGALAVAGRVPGASGVALAAAARRGFISGMDLGLIVASVVVAVAGIVVLAALPSRGEALPPARTRSRAAIPKVRPDRLPATRSQSRGRTTR